MEYTCDFCRERGKHVKKYHDPPRGDTWGVILYYCGNNWLCWKWFRWENGAFLASRPANKYPYELRFDILCEKFHKNISQLITDFIIPKYV
jgi:hypothetical protein